MSKTKTNDNLVMLFIKIPKLRSKTMQIINITEGLKKLLRGRFREVVTKAKKENGKRSEHKREYISELFSRRKISLLISLSIKLIMCH